LSEPDTLAPFENLPEMRSFHPDLARGPVMERENRMGSSGLSAILRRLLPILAGMNRSLLLLLALTAVPSAFALDGKWTPAQVLDIDPAWLAEQGLQLPPSGLWDGERGTGLLSGTVRIGGCSGGFVSATGLIVTNHHCLFSLVQEHSTPERDLINTGFLARVPADELPASTLRVEIPRRFTDVTASILAAVPDGADDRQRSAAIEARQQSLVATCEEQPDTRCKVAVFDEGVTYTLIESIELRDIRLVYAPPRAVGEYGGEIDNWMWPRHTGDFAIARVWAAADGRPADRGVDNVPFRPEFFFPITSDGLAERDFVMVLGYPGITYRSLIAEEMRERRERFFVRREDLFGEWIAHLEAASAESDAGRIALASNLKGIQNRYKNAQGQIAGLDRGGIIEEQRKHDDAVAAWAADQSDHASALAARDGLRALLIERERTWERDFLLNLVALGIESVPGSIPALPKGLYFGATLAHLARERTQADEARASGFRDSDVPRLRDGLEREQRNVFLPAERRLFAALVARALALPESQRLPSVDTHFGGLDSAQIGARIDAMLATTRLYDTDARLAMLQESEQQLIDRDDPLLAFGLAWNTDLRALRAQERDWNASSARHRPAWRHAVAAHAGQPIAPDANSTLRVSFAHVQGYVPRDGVRYTPFTSMAGAIEKHTGTAPFDLPDAVRAAARDRGGRWQDPRLGDLPINFLADGDTSGGNSGSPVVNGRGELVGVNFDRVWENVANDFGFNPAVARNVSVDIRYMLWLLETVEEAGELLQELGIDAAAAPQ